ncbi:carboxypeptidase-like regulatory domain-containing protein [Psychroflexus lacisalsi]|uniref:Carboxypeptidase-like regulatory domain-containing protein n=1 Tax=Psychroflexus lacisalsi TaxID=503928 RepID=A0ABN1KAI0_9FLAO
MSYGQLKFEGKVVDSLKTPLELANVVAINKETLALESYGITNTEGEFKLKLQKYQTYNIQVSYVGMETLKDSLSTEDKDITKNYSLRLENSLDEVTLNYKIPVKVQGDTLIYDADSFKNGSERKLEDIIKNLPGVEINEDGQIEVEGKVVNKLMVNGKDFFDGDTKLGTKNIPSNAVDKIQVLRNYSEVNQLSGVRNNQDNVAMNIKLKEGKENFWFGDVTLGGGASPDGGLYLLQPKLFYYSPEYTINFIGDLNNIGELALTRRDIRGFGGGFRSPSQSSGTDINLGDNGLGFLTSQNNAIEIENQLATANFSYSPQASLDLSGFVILNSSQILSRETSSVQYTNPELGIPDEDTDRSNIERSDQGLVKLSASYQPNVNNQLDYDVLGRISNDRQNQNAFSSVIGNTQQVEEVKPFSINQSLNYYYTLNADNIFAFEAQHVIKDEDPFYNARLDNDPDADTDAFDNTANALGLDNTMDNYDIGQNRRIKSNQIDAKLDYYNILNSVSNLNLTLGTIISQQKFDSNLFQFLEDGEPLAPTPNFNNGLAENDVIYNFSDIYLGAHYRLKTGKFTITPGFSLHAYGNKNIQFGETYEDNFFRLLPDFETRVQFKKSESLTFRYEMRNQFTDVTRLAEGIVLNSFNSIQFGEPDLQNALSHNLSLLYSSFNLFNYTNVFARLAYSNNIDQIRSLTNFESIIRTSTFFNSNFADETFSAFGRIQKTFGKIRATLNTNYNYTKINQFIQGQQSLNEGFTQTYTPALRTNFRVAPNISLSYAYSITNNNQGSRETTFTRNSPSVDFDAYIWKKLTFRTNYAYTTQKQANGQSQSFQTWDARLSYRKDKDSNWEYEIKATNILDIDAQVINSANNVSVFTSQTFIQPRFVTFRFVYSL